MSCARALWIPALTLVIIFSSCCVVAVIFPLLLRFFVLFVLPFPALPGAEEESAHFDNPHVCGCCGDMNNSGGRFGPDVTC